MQAIASKFTIKNVAVYVQINDMKVSSLDIVIVIAITAAVCRLLASSVNPSATNITWIRFSLASRIHL